MLRTFTEHVTRPAVALDGWWEFAIADDHRGRKRLPSVYPRKICVPSAWESQPGLENYRGKAWFRTTIEAVEGLNLRLVFGGVSHTGTVFVDGREFGRHYDAFTPWAVLVTGLAEGPHELVVEVDNSFGEHSALHIENDYYTYGGITRPVMLEYVPDLFIERLYINPAREGRKWALDVEVWLRNAGPASQRAEALVSAGDRDLTLGSVTVQGRTHRILKGRVDMTGLDEWSPQSPVLHFVEAVLQQDGELTDDLIDRTGLRDVRVRGKKILLNGKALRLRGYNRHEDHPQFGNALPVAAMVHDLEIMRDLGCNFVRTCHYPNDQRFLDLCDEMGFCVWEESHARTIDFRHPCYREQITASTIEMVEWHRNHPSILMWGCLNECESETAFGKKEYTYVLKLLRKLDATRPLTFASNRGDKDLCLGLVDIVSQNRYVGWYRKEPEDVAEETRKLLSWIHSDASHGGKGKPVILSEFGGGGIYGHRQTRAAHWSEEYQSRVLDESLRVYLNHPSIVGAAIWQFADCRVTWNWWGHRPRNMNNKGTVDEYRRPKQCYAVVKQRMLEAAAHDASGK